MDPPIQAEYFLSGGAINFTFTVDGTRAVISFLNLLAKTGYMVVTPDRTMLANKDLRMLTSHY
jgi:hypothetical protein